MQLDLKNYFTGEIEKPLVFSDRMDLSTLEINGSYPFVSPLSVRGTAKGMIGAVQLDFTVDFSFEMPCDLCVEETRQEQSLSFSHMLLFAEDVPGEKEGDRYIRVQSEQFLLDDLVREDLLLALPTRFLCREDCKGLCPICGVNHNAAACDCGKQQLDPRLEILQTLLDQE